MKEMFNYLIYAGIIAGIIAIMTETQLKPLRKDIEQLNKNYSFLYEKIQMI